MSRAFSPTTSSGQIQLVISDIRHRNNSTATKISAGNITPFDINIRNYQEEVKLLWQHGLLLQYKSSISEATARARIELSASTDAQSTKKAVKAIVQDLKDNLSRRLEEYRHEINKLVATLPSEQAQVVVDYWYSTYDYYMGVLRSFDNSFFATISVLTELNMKAIRQCDALEKENDGMYERMMMR